MKNLICVVLTALFSIGASHGWAQQKSISGDIVKIGVLADLTNIYQSLSGKGAIEATKMAVEDYGGTVLGKKIEVISADQQLKPDVAATMARTWFDTEGVDMITDIAGSSSALAVIDVAKQKDRVAIVVSAASSAIAGARCTPNSFHYGMTTSGISKAVGTSMVKRGLDTWYVLSVDNAFGKALEKDISDVVIANGGKVVGTARHPANPADFSAFMLQAKASGAKVIALANAGTDFVNSLKSAKDFGIGGDGKQTLVGMLIFLDDIHSIGLETAQGLTFTTPFYWDTDDDTRKFAKKFQKRVGKMPQMTHAGVYSSTMHYLRAVEAAGTDDAKEVMKKMKEMPVNDFFSRGGKIREDGLLMQDILLVQAKKPSESKGDWDYYKIVQKIPAADAYKPLSQSECPLVKH